MPTQSTLVHILLYINIYSLNIGLALHGLYPCWACFCVIIKHSYVEVLFKKVMLPLNLIDSIKIIFWPT